MSKFSSHFDDNPPLKEEKPANVKKVDLGAVVFDGPEVWGGSTAVGDDGWLKLLTGASITGTDEQIDVIKNALQEYVVSIASNPTIPGDSYIQIPSGPASSRPSAANSRIGMMRILTVETP